MLKSYTPENNRKPLVFQGFLLFSEDVKWEHWLKSWKQVKELCSHLTEKKPERGKWCHFKAILTSSNLTKKSSRKMCEICSKLAIKTLEQRQWHRSGVFLVNFGHISHLFLSIFIVVFEHTFCVLGLSTLLLTFNKFDLMFSALVLSFYL